MCASERGRETETGVEKGDFIKGMKDERFALRANLWTALKTYIFRTNPRKNLASFSLRLGLFFFFFSPWIRNEHLRYTIMRGIALVLIPISNPSRVQDTERQKQQPSLTQIHTHTGTPMLCSLYTRLCLLDCCCCPGSCHSFIVPFTAPACHPQHSTAQLSTGTA